MENRYLIVKNTSEQKKNEVLANSSKTQLHDY